MGMLLATLGGGMLKHLESPCTEAESLGMVAGQLLVRCRLHESFRLFG